MTGRREGSVFAGDFRIVRALARGGMGAVFVEPDGSGPTWIAAMPMFDPYRSVADALVEALSAARGDAAEEEAALRAAIEGYLEIAEADSGELGLAEYFAEEGTVESPPALKRVPGASEEDIFRWRELLTDLTDDEG